MVVSILNNDNMAVWSGSPWAARSEAVKYVRISDSRCGLKKLSGRTHETHLGHRDTSILVDLKFPENVRLIDSRPQCLKDTYIYILNH